MNDENINPDDLLSTSQFISKYQLQCTKYFGPDWAYGVISYRREWTAGEEDTIVIYARVKPAYHSTKGKFTVYTIDPKKFAVWRKNVNLYGFISVKP